MFIGLLLSVSFKLDNVQINIILPKNKQKTSNQVILNKNNFSLLCTEGCYQNKKEKVHFPPK